MARPQTRGDTPPQGANVRSRGTALTPANCVIRALSRRHVGVDQPSGFQASGKPRRAYPFE
jgi:hypothetical protein